MQLKCLEWCILHIKNIIYALLEESSIYWGKFFFLTYCWDLSSLKWSESRSVISYSLWPHGLYSPWNAPGQNTGKGSHSLLQWIFPTQGSNPGLPHCSRILYQLSYQESRRSEACSLFFSSSFFFFYCSGFCHTLKWISHGFTCVPHPDPPSHLPLHPIPLVLPSAPGPSACLTDACSLNHWTTREVPEEILLI